MKQSRYSETRILAILRQAEGGMPIAELCREHGMSNASFYKWRAKYGGMDTLMISSMKALEDENCRLKKMFAELSLQNELLRERLWGENNAAISAPGNGRVGRSEAKCQHCAGLPDVWGERDMLSLCSPAEE
ncbi:hypothetical protein AOE01nite_00520 [Acetobacter oeni]|uniref:Transposase n=1 Tax=Acetobacter oeni TaxID=304077 RepID=A0A511XFX4_9PROT|nr:transposase-like protein [Acetobacter oeni]GBR01203.1 transposase [Acetobacter oeni LMG 21952]GEN61828.1 hypothetical protein AOE01nite_00520 [Acetobacter oeni]